MENNNNINDLLNDGKKHLSNLQAELEKLANTAGKIADIKANEFSEKAEVLINETRAQVEAKTKEVRESEDFKNLEAEGKKTLEDIEGTLNNISAQLNDKLKNLFGSK
ncbi:MAG: hypothetical protein JST76_06705 [Bacteroidetes bacterium]|nr:hypothetical protein [Bacteroidota bacterium]